MTDAEKEEADEGGDGVGVAREMAERKAAFRGWVGGASADPHAEEPDGLPGEEVEGSGLLKRNFEAGEVNDEPVDPGAQAELGEEPDECAYGDEETPASAGGEG